MKYPVIIIIVYYANAATMLTQTAPGDYLVKNNYYLDMRVNFKTGPLSSWDPSSSSKAVHWILSLSYQTPSEIHHLLGRSEWYRPGINQWIIKYPSTYYYINFADLFSCHIDTRRTVMSSFKLYILKFAIVIILFQLVCYCSHSFTDLLAIGFIGLVLSPQVWIPAKEVTGKGRRFTALLHLNIYQVKDRWDCINLLLS